MADSIGLLELKSTPAGIETADEMLKAADVKLLMASPVCPGKYVIIVGGNVAAVRSAMKSGLVKAGSFLVAEHTINNVHGDVAPAILGTAYVEDVRAVGAVETITALSAVLAGDLAAKAANVALMEIRIARGLGGKSFVVYTGEVGAVTAARKAVLEGLREDGVVTGDCVIAAPHPELVRNLLAM